MTLSVAIIHLVDRSFTCLENLHPCVSLQEAQLTECQAGQWNPHPRDICGQGVTVMESGNQVMLNFC
jgi:hypothetical protein